MIGRILCFIGIHKYSMWRTIEITKNYIDEGIKTTIDGQTKYCLRCMHRKVRDI